MSHRVIAGKAKGIHLKLVPGNVARPIMDRVKEALFNILGNSLRDTRFLDLFAGTGAVGIEALSRGAAHATFLDVDKLALKIIQENLKATRFTDKASVQRADALAFLKRANLQPYTFVYIAPPQYKNMWKTALETLDAHPGCLEPDAQVIVQIAPSEKEAIMLKHLREHDERKYGKTLLWFFEYNEDDTKPEKEDRNGEQKILPAKE